MKLLKFRSLLSEDDYTIARGIIGTGDIWCSRFYNLNDTMEGVYKSNNDIDMTDVYKEKSSYVICSLSSPEALGNPLMWGYYGGGFKGIAIELEVKDCDITPVFYTNEVVDFGNSIPNAKKIITTKLKLWDHEKEYRFTTRGDESLKNIGRVTKVYYASPYGPTKNSNAMNGDSELITRYRNYIHGLKKENSGSNVFFIPMIINGNKVVEQQTEG